MQFVWLNKQLQQTFTFLVQPVDTTFYMKINVCIYGTMTYLA